MQLSWLHKEKNKKIILFFNGWGMDNNAVAHLSFTEYDVCMFNNYDCSIENFDVQFSEYDEINIIAWSVGVLIAELYMIKNKFHISRKIAISGTPLPAHDSYGIPVKIFKGTIENLNAVSLTKFQRRTCGCNETYEKCKHIFNQENIDYKKKELESILHLQSILSSEKIKWTQAILCKNDLIFPVKNLENYWLPSLNAIYIDAPHYPFYNWNSWEDIMK